MERSRDGAGDAFGRARELLREPPGIPSNPAPQGDRDDRSRRFSD